MSLEGIRGLERVPVAITIAGSDSGGGAGIQADLKTFAALGVHGTVAITSVTAQNTYSVKGVQDLDPEMVRLQIRAVAEDIGIDAGKTGMLHTEEIIKAVSDEASGQGFPLVVDPVMVAKSGAPLLRPEAVEALKRYLLPRAAVVTPNRFEAERLAEMEIRNIEEAKKAALKISGLGPESVVVKGGHLEEGEAVDIIFYEGKFTLLKAPRHDVKTTHGTGCCFSAAIAAGLAKGLKIPNAVEEAKRLVTLAIKYGLDIGKGHGPVNPMAHLYREASRHRVLSFVDEARALLEASPNVSRLVPEVGMNVAMAIPYPEGPEDVAALPGRVVRVLNGVRAVMPPRFGASSHLARYILEISRYDPSKLAALNMRFSEEALRRLEERDLKASCYEREKEPEDIKRREGMTIPWGVREAVKRLGKVPDIIYHRGDIGKEPMIVLLGRDARELARIVVEVAGEVSSG
ncbi:MAG: bifunctional hydroxymethylpyrimidine kinase/phosphomethylpyrimidine kinase [Candidatus Bathyarchaeia archaeon]|nr:bifunctional hydroxymethylpyrimidine kinase/phosphomethylpyrimidine kinase [Candidatus Bathyarchaeota archaeon]